MVLWNGVCGRSVEGQVYDMVECLNGNIGRAARRHESDGITWGGQGIRSRIIVIITFFVIMLDVCWACW